MLFFIYKALLNLKFLSEKGGEQNGRIKLKEFLTQIQFEGGDIK